jgi:hypothetical protein
MAEARRRTRHMDGHTKAEMNRNREQSFGGALTTRRHGPSDSPGLSSSRARSSRSGADRAESVMAKHAGAGGSGNIGAGRKANTERAPENRPKKRTRASR